MEMKGGMTDSNENSYRGDGRLKMARTLERRWPGVVTTRRRFQRPQHVVKANWAYFDTPLRLKPGINLGSLAANEYDLELVSVKETQSDRLKGFVSDWAAEHEPTLGAGDAS
jgi:hypothetical protein